LDDGGDRVYRVQVRIGGEEVGGVVEGVKKLQAETVAAWKAIGVLEGKIIGDVGVNRNGVAEEATEGAKGNEDVVMGGGEEVRGEGKHLQGAGDVAMDGDVSEEEFFNAEVDGGVMLED
jgi:hypothetical protein